MKKIISVLLSIMLLTTLFTGCGDNKGDTNVASDQGDKLKVVTTIFPVYDWAREIVGENSEYVDLTLLLKNGVDLHSYQPSSEDLAAIADADVFVYVGGHSDSWVEDALKNESNPDRITINLFEVLDGSLKPLVMTEGMEDAHNHHDDDHEEHTHNHDDHDHDHDEHDHNHDDHDHDHEEHDHDDHEHHHHDGENDEHVWLSLPRARTAVHAIADEFAKADPDHAEIYQTNAQNYEAELNDLDQQFREVSASGQVDTLVFADRFPFFYLADDYGLNYYAAFTGCAAESEASFETVALLAQKIDELGVKNVITMENRSHRIPETIIESTKSKNQDILVMNSLQSVTETQIAEGLTYLNVMKSNLDVLKAALQ